MKGNRKSVNEKSYIIPTESPEAIVLKYKATFFLAVIRSITKAFGPILKGFNAERYHAFSLQMILYTNRCLDLQDGSPTITQLWNNAPKRDRGNDAAENKDLDDIIENSYYRIVIFFEECNAAIQEEILAALRAEIRECIDEQGSKERLQEIFEKLDSQKKIGELDNTYDPKIAEILDVFTIGEIHNNTNLPLLTAAPIKRSKKGSIIDLSSIFNSKNTSEKPKELERSKSSISNDTQAILSDRDIYDFMTIDAKIFSGEKCLYEAIRRQFQEVFELEQKFLKFLEAILFIELPYIKQMIVTKESQHRFIEDFLQKLEICWQAQVELCARMKEYRNQFPLDSLETINENAMRLFLGIYEVDSLKKQIASFLQLEIYWPQVDDLLQEHKEAIQQLVLKPEQEIVFQGYKQKIAERLQEEKDEDKRVLPIIAWDFPYNIKARATQICTRRELLSTEIIKSLQFEENKLEENKLEEKVQERYNFIRYVPTRYNLMKVLKEDGYVRPKALLPLLEKYFNKNRRHSLAYFLIHPDGDEKLSIFKAAFISFAMRDEGNADKLRFFKEIYDLFQKKPLCLGDLKFLRRYLDASKPLGLAPLLLTNIKQALDATESHVAVKMKNIVAELIPAIEEVSAHLSLLLKEFNQSPDVVDFLLTVPDIKEKVGDKNSLAALDKEAIANLPPFWRDIFVSEEWVLRQSLTQKKDLLRPYRDKAPESVRKTLKLFLDSELSISYDQFIQYRELISKNLFMIEVEKQIKLLGGEEGIFSDAVLTMLNSHIQDKMPGLLQKLPQPNEPFFLFYYAEAILQIRYILIHILEEYLSAEKKKIGKTGGAIENRDIFSSHFRPNTKDTALDLKSLISLLKEAQRNRPRFHKSEKTTSAFRVFTLVKEKSKPDVYQKLKEEISVLSSRPGTLSKKARGIAGPTPGGKRVLPNGIPPEDSGSATPLPTPAIANSQNEKPRSNNASPYSTPRRMVKATGRIDFKALVGELDKVVKTERLELTKYIQSGVNRKECSTKDEKENCNYLEARKSDESKKLLFTAQSSDKGGSVTVHCHEEHLVAKTVAAMANSMRAATTTLEIDINASAAEIPKLINQYVGQALKKNLFPKVIVNGDILEPAELCKELDKSLALKYKEVSDAQKQVPLSESKLVFLAPAGSCSQQAQSAASDKSQQTTARRGLFY